MRLWAEQLIKILPDQQLLGQHRECCALRGNGWGKKHATVDYVFTYPPEYLVLYHWKVMQEMEERNFCPLVKWYNPYYRGEECLPYKEINPIKYMGQVYPEHNEGYVVECLDNIITKLKIKLDDTYERESSQTLKVSQDLDKLIVYKMKFFKKL